MPWQRRSPPCPLHPLQMYPPTPGPRFWVIEPFLEAQRLAVSDSRGSQTVTADGADGAADRPE